ncbi:MAG: flagellar biosynthetic protein FliR [Gammaproteobacteria bacterium]
MVTISSTQLVDLMVAYLWPFFRIAALITIAPIWGTKIIPVRARIGLALALTVIIVPVIEPVTTVEPFSLAGIVVTVNQVVIGLMMGFMLRMVFSALESGGQVIGMTMGLGFAQMNDPANGITVPVVSQFYTLIATLIFLALNGHLILINVLVDSFRTMPIDILAIGTNGLWILLTWAGWIFKGAVLIALPIVTALLLVNISFGVMMRAAPQLNVFAIGFPITLTLGFVFMLVSLPVFLPQFSGLLDKAFQALGGMFGG